MLCWRSWREREREKKRRNGSESNKCHLSPLPALPLNEAVGSSGQINQDSTRSALHYTHTAFLCSTWSSLSALIYFNVKLRFTDQCQYGLWLEMCLTMSGGEGCVKQHGPVLQFTMCMIWFITYLI